LRAPVESARKKFSSANGNERNKMSARLLVPGVDKFGAKQKKARVVGQAKARR
jgi:hypothetical protein